MMMMMERIADVVCFDRRARAHTHTHKLKSMFG